MKSETMKTFEESLKKNRKTVQDFCDEVGIPIVSFRAMTVSTKKQPKWIKSFFFGYNLKK